MERDLDMKLYNDYLSGERQAFEYLWKRGRFSFPFFENI